MPDPAVKRFFARPERLTAALSDPVLLQWDGKAEPGSDVQASAFEFSVALGLFPLFGVDDQAADFALEPAMAEAASAGARTFAAGLVATVRELDQRLDQIKTAAERDNAIISVLKARLEIEAAMIAIDVARDDALPAVSLRAQANLLHRMVEALDDQLDQIAHTICLVAELPWVDNVAQLLPADSWQPRPWWLTEQLAQQYALLVHERLATQEAIEQITWRLVPSPALPLPSDSESLHGGASLSLAADDKRTRPNVAVFAAEAENESIRLSFEIRVAAEYSGRNVESLSDQVPVTIVLSVIELASTKPDVGDIDDGIDPDCQQWRVRFGAVIETIVVKRIVDQPELTGTLSGRTVADVRKARSGGQWCELTMWRKG